MKSNGYGSWIASIVLTVDGPHAAQAAESLKTAPQHVDATTGVAKFKVEMRVSRRGDDETIFFELGHRLHLDPKHWAIDWKTSDYS